ncbi:hypothetical protein M0802_004817 [Mischocyttarus mexicanus]|nr:hypothetical protein M0802_004817 [Mischocyttarus mexicanus]
MATAKLRILSRNLQLSNLSANFQRSLNTIDEMKLKPEQVLSEQNRKSCIEKFKKLKLNVKYKDRSNQAAVLIPICIHKGELGLLYTLRSSKLNSNRGQVSFPGGMYDKTDRDLEETALRETWEELKIPKEQIDVWTCCNFFPAQKLAVMPVLGYVGEIDPENLKINPDEVEEAFVIHLKDLCNPSLCRFTHFRDICMLPTYLGGKHRVWGLTGAITHVVLSSLLPGIYTHDIVNLRNMTPSKLRTTNKNNIK